MSTTLKGSMVLGERDSQHRHCDRCGRKVKAGRRRKDGLVLCGDCGLDHWLITRFAARVKE